MKISDTKKLAAITAAFFLTVTAFSGCSESANSSQTTSSVSQAAKSDIDASIAAEDIDVGYDEESSVGITFADGSAAIDGEGATAEGETVTISQAGTYILSGTATNGRIIVSADKTAEIKLIFNGVDITCADNAPLLVSKAKKVYIVLEDGTENVLTDSASYSLGEDDSNTDGAIFSKADLTINGSGTLTVNANYKHGIVSKDDLVITDGNINVTSASTAMEGKDSVKISGGTFNISAGTNGIKATNTEASDKGFISVTGGIFTVVANNDAFEAETVLSIQGGSFDITTGGGSANASMKSDGTPNRNWQNNMGNGGGGPNGMGRPDDNGNGTGGEPPAMPTADNTDTTDSTSTSAKALKAGSEMNISGGELKIDSADDSVHSNGNIVITGGNISVASGDNGMHANGNLTISDGTVDITKSYEGIEGSIVTIDGGTISVVASDDGINCAGGSDTGSTDRMGADQFSAQEGVELNINGGTVTIDADGDGLDSNGNFTMTGGTVCVCGPTNGGNGALDYNGTATVTGGTLIACGAVGMEEGFGDSSTQYSVLHDLGSTVSANEKLTITNSDGKEILRFTPTKTWQSVVFTSADLKECETYTITAGLQSETVTIDGIVTSNSKGKNFGGGHGGRRGF
ncbi:carbohydrate-binding domain-containing protein [Ruminococcus sp.]|uniref:carbohydrate-binding domain-containing protein n=1 Tax=Ruminococcus sp. TaxID=41978 RepID=UPI00257A45EA|nr:carbohydrate-binding domain-containing protein [Ruminococcus sp.]